MICASAQRKDVRGPLRQVSAFSQCQLAGGVKRGQTFIAQNRVDSVASCDIVRPSAADGDVVATANIDRLSGAGVGASDSDRSDLVVQERDRAFTCDDGIVAVAGRDIVTGVSADHKR